MVFIAIPLVAPDSAPAPAITKLVHLDEKLRFVREHPAFEPTVIAVGSSVTWRQLSGEAFETLAGGPHRFLNGATGHLQIHQTRALTKFYLTHYRTVRTVLVMVSLVDFRDCTGEPRDMFEPKDAARYAFGGWPALYFHLRYFSPGRYAKTVMTLKRRQTPLTGDLYNDRYGSGPIALSGGVTLGLRYKKIDADPACVDELIGLARDMDDRNVRLALVFTPVHPKYRVRYIDGIDWLENVASRLEREKRRIGKNLEITNFIRTPSFDEKSFYDAFHLQWPAVRQLSARIARAINRAPPADGKGGLIYQHETSPERISEQPDKHQSMAGFDP
jgi:hypothetical protein